MAKSMLHEKGLPYKMWGEAINTVVYLLNRCSTSALDKVTPFEAYSGRRLGIKHLKKSDSEATLYTKGKEGAGMFLMSIYVDDIIYTRSSIEMMEEFKADMMHKYEMTDLGLLYHFLRMETMQIETSIFIHQKKYATSLLKKFGLQYCKPVSILLVPNDKLRKDDDSGATDEAQFRKIVGNLLYLTATRPYIMYAWVLSDWSGSEDDMRITSGYAFTFGSRVFSWSLVKQHCVALSPAKVEYKQPG
ncbi:uncharacterized mitochondrial protein AtMg00810-like [Malus sylvestris]|uniref:uncharacterized mitochondrial protein AtMg00810-like n=1 Tax=Malus sylvestris TaxID=3752 RepID=UPI0021ACAC87|nr:uncharacterized mitochondrial protein AtMg00810-like [Malus sylvestris]